MKLFSKVILVLGLLLFPLSSETSEVYWLDIVGYPAIGNATRHVQILVTTTMFNGDEFGTGYYDNIQHTQFKMAISQEEAYQLIDALKLWLEGDDSENRIWSKQRIYIDKR